MRTLLAWPEIAGVAEVMDMRGVIECRPRMRGIVGAGLASGKLVCGHARDLAGTKLAAFAAAGLRMVDRPRFTRWQGRSATGAAWRRRPGARRARRLEPLDRCARHHGLARQPQPDGVRARPRRHGGRGGGQVLALVALPVCGVLSEAPAAAVSAAFAAVREAAIGIADRGLPPLVFRVCVGASLAWNPGPHVADLGIADGGTGAPFASSIVDFTPVPYRATG